MHAWLLLVAVLGSACAQNEAITQAADRVLVEKSARRLTLFKAGQELASFDVSLGADPVGHKQQEGDERTPEGVYSVDLRKADSAFYRALRVSYPNAEDRAHASRMGVDPGGQIMIHGMRNGLGLIGSLHTWFDWTDGCIAITNAEMDIVWASVELGTPIEIVP